MTTSFPALRTFVGLVVSIGLAGLAALADFATFAALELARPDDERVGISVLCKFHICEIYTNSSLTATGLIGALRKRPSAFCIINEHFWKKLG